MNPAMKDARKPFSLSVPLLAFTFFVVATAVIIGIAYRYYRAQKEAIEHEVRNQLLSIADLKVKEISDWLAQGQSTSRMRVGPGFGGEPGSRTGEASAAAGFCHEAKEVSAKVRARSSVSAPETMSVAFPGRAARRQKLARSWRVSAARSAASPETRRP